MTPTPSTPNRVRHQPTPRDPALPPTMRVAVEVGYVQTCPDCRRIVAELAQGCIADPTVTGFRLTPGRKHAHEVTEGAQSLPGLTTGESAAAIPVSDTNGNAPEDVEAALFAAEHDPFLHASGLNGFDPQERA